MEATAVIMTVGEFLSLPEPKEGRYELHHGELVLMLPSKTGHQRIQERCREILSRLARDHQPGFLIERVEMSFQPTPEHEVWRADVGVVLAERDERTPEDQYLQGAPELVIEVLSPGNTVDEREDKKQTCLEHGCVSFWEVDAKRREVRVTGVDLVTHRYAAELPVQLLPGASFPVASIFCRGRITGERTRGLWRVLSRTINRG